MDVAVLNVHLDLGAGRRGTDMGPSALHVAGLVPALRRLGHHLQHIASIGSPVSYEAGEPGEVDARFLPAIAAVCQQVAAATEGAARAGALPLVLGGDHSLAAGSIGGVARVARARGQRLGVVWVDAHTDMNTPATSPSGNVHGMPLACLLGDGPAAMTSELFGAPSAVRAEDVVVIGVRDVDSAESAIVRRLGVRVYTMAEIDTRGIAACLREALGRLRDADAGIYLSLDLDGVDPRDAPGVGTPVPGGLSVRESHLICEWLSQSRRLVGMDLVELNPTADVRNQTAELGRWLIESALGRQILS